MTNWLYPWNYEEGIHNFLSPSDFARRANIKDIEHVTRAIKNGKIKVETFVDDSYIVQKNGHCYINGVLISIL